MPKTKYKEQPPEKRVKNFNEVTLGYTEEEAVREASRCLDCKKPYCVSGCPVEIDIPHFIRLIKTKKFGEAARVLREKNNLPAVCGRVCPQETQCEKVCVLSGKGEPVAIGRLERFAADHEINKSIVGTRNPELGTRTETDEPRTTSPGPRIKVAIIGSGPAGLTCAADLAKKGYDVTIFESLHKAGGVLIYGIPEFRLPDRVVNVEINYIKNLGVKVVLNAIIGRTFTVEHLREKGFKAFFVATGAGLPYFMNIEGENLNGVYSANEFLTRINLMKAYLFPEYDTPVSIGKKVAVIGAGNVAFDCARCALRLGAEEVTIVYRRTKNEMPARREEILHAEEEGVKMELLTSPLKISGNKNGWVSSMECVRNVLGEPDETGRRRPVVKKGTEFTMELDTIVCAIGQGPNPLILDTIKNLKLTGKGNIDANFTSGETSVKDIFAGGDIVTGAATVIAAMGAGKRAARSIEKYLSAL